MASSSTAAAPRRSVRIKKQAEEAAKKPKCSGDAAPTKVTKSPTKANTAKKRATTKKTTTKTTQSTTTKKAAPKKATPKKKTTKKAAAGSTGKRGRPSGSVTKAGVKKSVARKTSSTSQAVATARKLKEVCPTVQLADPKFRMSAEVSHPS